eukprot:s2875_g5.t1
MPIEKSPARNGDLPVLLDGEEIRFSEPKTRLYTRQHLEGEGVLHLTTKRLVWLGGPGCAIDYPFITMHAVSRDQSAWPDPCLYCQLREEEAEEEEEDANIPELRFVPAEPAHLQEMFHVFSEMSALNPDPYDEQGDDSGSEPDLDEMLGGQCQPQNELGVMWNAEANDAAMEDAEEDDNDERMSGRIVLHQAEQASKISVRAGALQAKGPVQLCHAVFQKRMTSHPSWILACVTCITLSDAAPLTAENAPWNINIETQHEPDKYKGKWQNHVYFPSPKDWRSLSIYQLLTDRFADGDPRNNELFDGGFDVRDMTFRHGGDFVGLTNKLPYIKGLGCQGVWISPIFQNGFNFYHQYAQIDFTLLDQRMGTLQELRNLVTTAHDLGMYVIVDVVMNHMANEFFVDGHEYTQAPFRFHEDGGLREYLLQARKDESLMHDTPAGKQPYRDFYYDNTWVPSAKYSGKVYGQYGEWRTDDGNGTYDLSDFHHNGDLVDYFDPWEINFGKIYGTMDDLRLEHERVQQKYIAMTRALIESCDIDGFRVDTPMQVPLNFFKVWAPAMRQHAASLGKERFGIFGEFYVTPSRYATMTGRGRDNTMYGQDVFIDGAATLKGGIVYPYYWYIFTAMVYKDPQYADGLIMAYTEENKMIDTFDPTTNRSEYAMMTFCNNHDNWRMQSMTGKAEMRMCLAVITFWPGIPLHYAGDEQDFDTPGSALDGWAREELSASLAWQAIPTRPDGNPADRDNFDMTSETYRYIARLNALRRWYFGDFGRAECDVVTAPNPQIPGIAVFERGCDSLKKVLVVASFETVENKTVRIPVSWVSGTQLSDSLEVRNPLMLTVSPTRDVSIKLQPLAAYVLVPLPVATVPPSVVSVTPAHGSVAEWSADAGDVVNVTIRFDRAMQPSVLSAALFDGQPAAFRCATPACQEITLELDAASVSNQVHHVSIIETATSQDGVPLFASFRSSFVVDRSFGVLSRPWLHSMPGLVCANWTRICHNATGASWLRIKNVGGAWSEWKSAEPVTAWQSAPGIPVLVQYHAEGSASFIVGDCVDMEGPCFASWHESMFLRGQFNRWGEAGEGTMVKLDHFTWAANITVDRFLKGKFAPFRDWTVSYGLHPARELLYNMPSFDPRFYTFHVDPHMSGSEASRRWMEERGHWSANQGMASGAEWATEILGSSLQEWCETVGTYRCVEYKANDFSPEMSGCGAFSCCKRKVSTVPSGPPATCCVLFNDLLLNYTVSADLSKCSKFGSTTLTTSMALKTCPGARNITLEDSRSASQVPPSPFPTDPRIQESLGWSRGRVLEAEEEFEKSGYERFRSPETWHEDVAYSILVDRFANGDLSNDEVNIPDFQREELKDGQPWSIHQWRHGGDLQGVKGRLMYLKQLGVTTVVLSPIFLNSAGEYHGSCTSDLSKIDPGFGSPELLRDLVQDAHALDMRVVLDVQVNHICAKGMGYTTNPAVDSVSQCVKETEQAYWGMDRGFPLFPSQSRKEMSWGNDLPEYMRHQSFFVRCGPKAMYRDPTTI